MRPISRSPSYLVRNQYSYCFRMIIPEDLRKIMGKRELRYSLKTGYLGEAKHRARMIASEVQRIFRYMRKGNGKLSALTDEKIKELTQLYLNRYVEGLEERYLEGLLLFFDSKDLDCYYRDLDSLKEDIVRYLGLGEYETVDSIVDDLLKENGIEGIKEGSRQYKSLCRGILRAQLKGIDVEKRHMRGDYSYMDEFPTDSPSFVQSTTALKPDEQTSEPLDKILESYLAENDKAGNWSVRTRTEYLTCLNLISRILGNPPIHTINFEVMRNFKE